jgi:predicted TIM-barrel fold metal-dependent hydrolase
MYDGPIIDCDVHHNPVDRREYLQYLPPEWREFVESPGGGRTVPLITPGMNVDLPDGLNKRVDAFPATGGPAGSDYDLLRDQLLDPYGVEKVVLDFDVGQEVALPNGDLALAMCRAMNDWSADKWLNRGDDRLCGALLVPTHFPEEAAKEIRRAGANERFATAYLAYNGLARPFGHPVYDPIHEAAAEVGLPIHLHVNGGEFLGGTAPYMSGGQPHQYRYEAYVVGFQATAAHVTSMIVHGVFEKFPSLKLLLAECGVAWLPWLGTTLDTNYSLMRRESRWVKRLPSDYLRDHLAVATQPCEAGIEEREAFVAHMTLFEGVENVLVFASDYPHWDTDAPTYISSILPKSWHDLVFHGNARRALRLPQASAPTPSRRERVTLS